MKRLIATATLGLLLAACAGEADGSGESDAPSFDAAGISKQLDCQSSVETGLENNEPARDERVNCGDLTIVTFADEANRDDYISTVVALNKAFGDEYSALVGDDWTVMGSPADVTDAQATLGKGQTVGD